MTHPYYHWQPDPPPVTEVNGGIACPNCGAADPRWTWIEYSGSTGVSHPDGGPQEYASQAGWKCAECGHVEEETDG